MRLSPLFVCCLVWACACQSRSTSEAPVVENRAPNIIFILADDLGYGDLGCYGQSVIQTPRLDRMAAEGLRFTQHYAGNTVCAPSRCALLTGLHTGHSYVRGNKEVQPEGQAPLPDATVTVAERLQTAGYTTAVIGKWGLGYPGSEGVPNRQGFDYFFGYNCQRAAHHHYPDSLWRNDTKVALAGNAHQQRQTYSHDLFTDQALAFVEEHQQRPFFLYLAYSLPHADVDVPDDSQQPYAGRFDEEPFAGNAGGYVAQPTPKAAYAGMVSRLDRDVGRLLDRLQTLGMAEQTLVIFTSDNGPHQEGGHHPENFDSSGPLRGHKRDMYEGGIRVPMLAWWPGTIAAGRTTDHVSAFWDFMPTACALAGVEVDTRTDGISYLPTLMDRGTQPTHAYLYWEFTEQGGKQALRQGDWKGIRRNLADDPAGPLELYDLATDPGETKNVAAQHPEVTQQLAERMQAAHEPSTLFPLPYESTTGTGLMP
ncbi:Arylsulfatase A [Catalinimonas alkaloidigena]|uniref:Arylsulfatase A n=1 Tax=Catalinimonas alkaloidigena TaxID=1075417 RepID=A0A1G9J902_9BACT|nr:arylsulfatase [Catalinimonas alkaloidigena]SDL33675.1 Arylsulfatase A [Catalinimonas alkaloidigena]